MNRREEYKEYLKSNTWKEKRRKVLKRDRYRCKGKNCKAKSKLSVHHKKYPEEFGKEPLTYLVTLCNSCHFYVHKLERTKNISLEEASNYILRIGRFSFYNKNKLTTKVNKTTSNKILKA